METDITDKVKSVIRYSLPAIFILAIVFIGGIFMWYQHKSAITINDAKLTSSLVHVSSQSDGTLTEILVNDGDKIEAGQVIAKVKVIVTPEQIQVLQKAYDDAQSNYSKLEQQMKSSMSAVTTYSSPRSSGDIAGAQARLDAAAAEKQKMEKLYSIGAVSATQYAEAQSAYASAQAALNAASRPVQQEVQTSAAPSRELSEALANAQIQLTQAKAALDQAQSDDNYAEITAPVSGIIYLTDFKQGDTLKQGDVFINIGNTKNLWIEAPLTEEQYSEVHPGQFVRYTLDGMDLTGTVLEVTHQNNENGESAESSEAESESADSANNTDANTNSRTIITAARISFPDDMIEQVVPGADVKVTITLDR